MHDHIWTRIEAKIAMMMRKNDAEEKEKRKTGDERIQFFPHHC